MYTSIEDDKNPHKKKSFSSRGNKVDYFHHQINHAHQMKHVDAKRLMPMNNCKYETEDDSKEIRIKKL